MIDNLIPGILASVLLFGFGAVFGFLLGIATERYFTQRENKEQP